MKLELEQADIEAIAKEAAQEVLKALQPIMSGKETEDKLLTVDDLCAYLQVDKGWVYQQVHSKSIPYLKANAHLRFRKSAIDKYLSDGCK